MVDEIFTHDETAFKHVLPEAPMEVFFCPAHGVIFAIASQPISRGSLGVSSGMVRISVRVIGFPGFP